MPERWWVIPMEPERETLSAMLKRLRQPRTMRELAEGFGWSVREFDKYGRYERGSVDEPDKDMMAQLDRFYGLPEGTLDEVALRTKLAKRRTKHALPGPSLAVPNDPLISELLAVVGAVDDADVPLIVRNVRQFAEEAARRKQARPEDMRRAGEGAT